LNKQEKAAQKPPYKPFKDYEPGYVHVVVKYLPKMPDEDQKRYLFVAIDRHRSGLGLIWTFRLCQR